LFSLHGDVVRLTDKSGTVVKEYEYDAFGNQQGNGKDKEDTNPFRYCGEYFDLSSGTYFLRNRYYSPNNGRFLTEEPAQAGLNWYTYCENNPIFYIDPSGLISYVIYSYDDNKKQAEVIQQQLTKKYGTATFVMNVQSAKEFVDTWNNLGYINGEHFSIDAVEIITHGHVSYDKDSPKYGIGYLQFNGNDAKSTTYFYSQNFGSIGENNRSIDDISAKSMDLLYFSACNTANPDFKSNIAQAFYDKNPYINTVTGWDGGVGFVFESRNPFFKTKQDYPTPDGNNGTFDTFRERGQNPNRKRQGKVEMRNYYLIPAK